MSEQARKEFERWMQHADGEILEELKRIEHDPEEIEKRFGHKQTFGTAGIRSVMAAGIANLNTYTVRQTARGLAVYLAGVPGEKSCAIGYDCRHNSRRFAEICAAALAESGVHVHLYDRLWPARAKYNAPNQGLPGSAYFLPRLPGRQFQNLLL